jgi:hypothetical protein
MYRGLMCRHSEQKQATDSPPLGTELPLNTDNCNLPTFVTERAHS